jgi:hypothetical protein
MIGKVFDLAKPRPRDYILDHPDFKPNFDQAYEEKNDLLP